MSKKVFWVSIAGIVISFAGGFLIANAINRNEINTLTAENGRLKKSSGELASGKTNPGLSAELIQEKIAEAEKNKDNFTFQKGLGLALYRYSNMTQDADLLSDIKKLLVRANELNPDDYDVLVSLGNVCFDIGRIEKNTESLAKARGFYAKALEKNSRDINVRTDLGWTYLFSDPAETDKAIGEFRKSLEINAQHEKSLQLISEAFIKDGRLADAKENLAKLRSVNPQNSEIARLEKQLETEKK